MTSARPAVRARGFTLIEVLGAIFLTSVVVTVAVSFFLNMSNASNRALESMQEGLRASIVLDRIARDLSGATLLTRDPSADPYSHPWYFTATSQYTFAGADRIKFTTRSQQPRVSNTHGSDLAEVSFFTTEEEDGTYTLYRWVSNALPLAVDDGFPSPDDERSFVLAEGLGGFSLRFRNADGEWQDEWDSIQLQNSGELPTAVEVQVLLWDADEEAVVEALEGDVPMYTRRVVMRQRPLDLIGMIQEKAEAETAAAAGGNQQDDDDGTGGGMSIAECVQANLALCIAEQGEETCNALLGVTTVPASNYPDLAAQYGCL